MGTLTVRWKHYDPQGPPCPQAKERVVERAGGLFRKRWQSLLVLEGAAPSNEQFVWILHQMPRIEWVLFQTPRMGFAQQRNGMPFQILMKGL